MLKLDFTIVTIEDVPPSLGFSQNPDYIPRKHELDTITNYILYGKDPYIDKKGNYDETLPMEKWTNMTARKEIEIPTKYSTWAKKQPVSLEETLESPSFNELELLRAPLHTKVPKPVFERELEKDIPSIDELWESIDFYSEKIKDPELDPTKKYQYTHMLVELRRQQFTMRDMFKPVHGPSNSANRSSHILDKNDMEIDWEVIENGKFGCAPMGLYHKRDLRFENPLALANELDYWGYDKNAEIILDFTNGAHIDKIVYFYDDLAQVGEYNVISSQKDIVDTLHFYINKTKLNQSQLMILAYKIAHFPNKDIAEIVNREFNKTYTVNYISTIYQKICGSIAESASNVLEYYTERINPFAFKRCTACGA